MKIKLTGGDIEHIRKSFGMNQDAFASVLAVHTGTVRRWESAGDRPVSVDGVAAGVLAVARQRLQRPPTPTPEELRRVGETVVATLAAAGALLALAWLINWLTNGRS